MTIPSLVAKPQYRGTASGFAYMFVKLPTFIGIFLFPSLFDSIGQANATLLVVVFPLIGLLAAISCARYASLNPSLTQISVGAYLTSTASPLISDSGLQPLAGCGKTNVSQSIT